MKHLVIYAHPNPKSFCHSIVEQVKKVSEEKHINTVVRDLYEIRFDPVLKADDFVNLQAGKIPPDIAKEQEYVKAADLITLVFPTWWAGMPAIVKGYIDRVFQYGFAYAINESGIAPLLKGKKVQIFSPHGQTNEVYEKTGMHRAMTLTTDLGIFQFCGIEVLSHDFFGPSTSVSDEIRKEWLSQISNRTTTNLTRI